MRRFVAGALLLLLVGESSGVALGVTPGTPGASGSGFNLLAAVIDPVRSSILSSRVYAIATGSENRYGAMHAPEPKITRPAPQVDAAGLIRRERPILPHVHHGVLQTVRARHVAIDPHHRERDPLAMRRSPLLSPGPTTNGLSEPLHTLAQAPLASAQGIHQLATQRGGHIKPLQSSCVSASTGAEHWWTYEERAVPGIGKAMVNVGTGNFIVSAVDVDVPEQGIDLAFQRVYNSQSLHDYPGDDCGDHAIFGNKWTNTFDANIVYDPVAITLTVYDIDGTSCTYASDGKGNWIPCTGRYETLEPVPNSNDCSYQWLRRNGTYYVFNTDISGTGCSIQQAKKGHLAEIEARNQTNYITFNYSYYGSGRGSEDVAEIDAVHSDNDELKMVFGIISNTSINELKEITRPDGMVVQYLYDTTGNLLEVDKPGNNSAASISSPPPTLPQGDVPETYAYVSGTYTLQEACGPRCTVSTWSGSNNDGSALVFAADGSERLTDWQVYGSLNIIPDDGTATALQAGSTNFKTWYTANFVYGQGTACLNTSSGTTTMCDTYGHATAWATDNSDRVTETQEWTGPSSAITTSQMWDNNNNLTSTTDANNYVTTYGYDTAGFNVGNMVEMQLPQDSDFTVNGQNVTLAPLSFFSYDDNYNVTASCDPVWTKNNGKSWNSSPTDSLCSGGDGKFAKLAYLTDGNEPFGCLGTITKPGGYATTISYGTGGNCGVGMPTKTQGAPISQPTSPPTRTPTQDFHYDPHGNLSSYDRGSDGSYNLDSWTLVYDLENQLQQTTQNDSEIGLTGSSFTCRYLDGSVFYTETPYQQDLDNFPSCPTTGQLQAGSVAPPSHATAYYYDLDGDAVKIITHKGCDDANSKCPGLQPNTVCNSKEKSNPIGTTCNYYDGLDRLVEVIEPYDTRQFGNSGPYYEFYTFRWMTRYIYDLSSNGAADLSISDSTGSTGDFAAYGGLYKTQEYLPQLPGMQASLAGWNRQQTTGKWNDVRGSSFDPLDRVVNKYELAFGTDAVTKNTYDCSGQAGELCQTVNDPGQITTYKYDALQRLKEEDFSGAGPPADSRSYTFDPDGRTATAKNTMGTLSYTYDVDGNKLSTSEPGNQHAASLICYDYYPDGMREYLSITTVGSDCQHIQNTIPGNGGISQSHIFEYTYTQDGLLADQQVTWENNTPNFQWSYYPSDRQMSETDPLYGYPAYDVNGIKTTFGSKAYSYDSFGHVKKLTFPEGYTLSSYAYDYDDDLLSYAVAGITRSFTLNVRGEMLEDSTSNPTLLAQNTTYSANGAQVGNGDSVQDGSAMELPPTTLQFDVRSNMVKCIPDPQWAILRGTDDWTQHYDSAGRQTGVEVDQSGSCSYSNATYSTGYDAENHIQTTDNMYSWNNSQAWNDNQDRNPGSEASGAVQWGPDGRHRVDQLYSQDNEAGTETDISAHWDGDTMLFATNPFLESGALLYIGKNGVMDVGGNIKISDRDQTGAQLTTHSYSTSPDGWMTNGYWFTALSLGSVRNLYVNKSGKKVDLQFAPGSCGYPDSHGTQKDCPIFGAAFAMVRADGYGMLGGLVQGARTYDPTSGQWLTPDPYAGDVNSPMSQKPFMWAGNNSIAYGDPSGYDYTSTGEDGSGGQPLFEDSTLTGTAGYDLAEFGQAITQVTLSNAAVYTDKSADQSAVPSSLDIKPAETQNFTYQKYYHYQILNSQGQPVTGKDYYSIEQVIDLGGNDVETSNGTPIKAVGTEIVDGVGLQDPPSPWDHQLTMQLQTFTVESSQGVKYSMPDTFVHVVDVEGREVDTSVGRVVPDQPWYM